MRLSFGIRVKANEAGRVSAMRVVPRDPDLDAVWIRDIEAGPKAREVPDLRVWDTEPVAPLGHRCQQFFRWRKQREHVEPFELWCARAVLSLSQGDLDPSVPVEQPHPA